jgi:hypothetical protein
MTCTDVKYTLADYLRGKVSQQEYRDVRDHLAVCELCRSEAEGLSSFFELVKDEKHWTPSDAYWINIIPKIQQRLEDRRVKYLPAWAVRFALPMAAAIALIIFSFKYFNTAPLETNQTVQSALAQLPQDELQYYVEQQSIVGVIGDQISNNGSIVSEDDKLILKNIIQVGNYSTESEFDYESLLDSLSEQEANNIVSILEKKLVSS